MKQAGPRISQPSAKNASGPSQPPPARAVKASKPLIAAIVVGSFLGLAGLIAYLAMRGTLSPQMATLMVIALFGLYVGFGILIAAYRLVSKLD